MLWTYLGAALLLLVISLLGLNVLAALRRMREDAARSALDLARFQEELAILREKHRKVASEPLPWNGFRKFVVNRKTLDGPGVCSFYLTPHDAKSLPAFKPGQYVTFRLPDARHGGQLIRCYSLSDHPAQPHYRVTIKRAGTTDGAGAPVAGVCSSIFHDQIREGDILDLRAPLGHFTIEPTDPEPVVLIGSGIGITPIFSMLATLMHQQSRRTIWFFHGVRNSREHLFKIELAAFARANPQLHLRTCYSQPGPADRLGEDYQVAGRVTLELLQRELPSNNFRFYYCGPGAMMEELTSGLKQWGVPDTHLHFEAFGALSVKRVGHVTAGPATPAAARPLVTFRKTGTTVPWDGAHETLLDLADHLGIGIASGCRAGNCGTCVLAMQSGEVSYIQPPGSPPEARTCLTCIAQPKGNVVLDA